MACKETPAPGQIWEVVDWKYVKEMWGAVVVKFPTEPTPLYIDPKSKYLYFGEVSWLPTDLSTAKFFRKFGRRVG